MFDLEEKSDWMIELQDEIGRMVDLVDLGEHK
jgi:hypothetical protein